MKETSHDADVVAAFITAINRHDLAALADLMSEDHTFIDSLGGRVSGRKEMITGWKAYFAMFPDFKILVDTTLNDNSTVAVFGSVSRGLTTVSEVSFQKTESQCQPRGKQMSRTVR